ncbi:MAG: hypothetical protein ACRD0G_19710 [Acidimicrobiales bacterium]
MNGCQLCQLDLDHCHATLVEHDDGTFDCLAGCGRPRACHDVSLRCGELEGACPCSATDNGVRDAVATRTLAA